MTSSDTSWGLIFDAALGDAQRREQFAHHYDPVLRAYFRARWPYPPAREHIDDAVQEVFVDCFKDGGALRRADAARGGFRAFLHGIARNVALNFEKRIGRRKEQQPSTTFLDGLQGAEEHAQVFERAWAFAVMREALERMEQNARHRGQRELRQIEIMRLRIHADLPIRDVALQLGMQPELAHAEYRAARTRFKRILVEVVQQHLPSANRAEVIAECKHLLQLLHPSD